MHSKHFPSLLKIFELTISKTLDFYWKGNLITIPRMCLKQSLFHFKWVLQAILSLTVLSNCVLGSSNLDTAFLSDCTKFYIFFLGY